MTIQEVPFFTIIIVALGPKSHLISLAIENLIHQTYKNFEVVIADAREEKAALSLHSLKERTILLDLALDIKPVEMLRLAVRQAKGRYIHILSCGEYYLATHCLEWIAHALVAEKFPALLCCGFIRHLDLAATQFLYFPISKKNLIHGKFPPRSACFWQKDKIASLLSDDRTKWHRFVHGDLLCRYVAMRQPAAFIKRIFVDSIYQAGASRKRKERLVEMGNLLIHRFGLRFALLTWLYFIPLQLMQSWKLEIKRMFSPMV